MKADNTNTLGSGVLRNSTRIASTDTYGVGDLIIVDVAAAAYGCGVWPAVSASLRIWYAEKGS